MKDLYKHIKGTGNNVSKKEFKESVFDLCDQFLKKEKSLTEEEKRKVYQLRAFIDINFNDFI